MFYNIKTIGEVPEKILEKAKQIITGVIHWKKIKRLPGYKSYRVTDCFRLLKIRGSNELLLMDHKHYNRYIQN